jgi:hypothetical protein
MAIDISAVGSSVRIKAGGIDINITQFSDEGTPFECADVDLSENKKNLNGQMISSRTPSVYPVSVTVVAGSIEDKQLARLAQKSAIMPGSVQPISSIIVDEITLTIPNINMSGEGSVASMSYVWLKGRMKNAPTGPSTSAEGRLAPRTYTFEMEQYRPPTGSATSI